MEQEEYLRKIKKRFSLGDITNNFEKTEGLRVLVMGDAIIDEYVFTLPKGRAVKDPILSVEFKYEEEYPGGALAVANHVAGFVKRVKLVTLLGDRRSKLEFIKGSLKKNVELKAFTKPDSHTIVKRRYIDQYRNNKLFKIEYMNDHPISQKLSQEIVVFLEEELPKYDVVLVADFGHGFINKDIRGTLKAKSKFMALNAQSNSSNMGYNYFTLYGRPDFISLAEEELRLPLSKRFEEIEGVMNEAHERLALNNFIITLGKKGCAYFHDGKIFKAPILTPFVVDTVGAGDAVFAVMSLLAYSGVDDELVPFIANSAGGIAVNIMGNKESITREKLCDFMKEKLK